MKLPEKNLKLLVVKTVLLLLILFNFEPCYSQSNLSQEEVTELLELKNNIAGTYQVQIINSRNLPTIPLSIYSDIEDIRDEFEIKYIYFSDKIRIKVLPLSTINSSDFIPVEYISYIIIQ